MSLQRVTLLLFFAALGAACTGTELPSGPGGTLTGVVVKGPVAKADVRVFRLLGTERGAEVGRGATDDAGGYHVDVGIEEGPFLVVVTGGSFVDEASATPVSLGTTELTALVPSFTAGTHLTDVAVNVVTHLTAGLSLYYARVEHQDIVQAHREASGHLNNHFGALDWSRVVPADLTTEAVPILDDAAKAGLITAALSLQARGISDAAGLTPAARVQSLTLLSALYDDLAYDGYFDGDVAQPLVLPPGMEIRSAGTTATRLDSSIPRVRLARAIEGWLTSDRNTATFAPADARQLQDDLSRGSNPRIFRTPGQSGFDNTPPTVSWNVRFTLEGAEGPVQAVGEKNLVGGVLQVQALANDPSGMKSLEVMIANAPMPPVPQGNSAYRYEGTWKTDQDGPLTLVAKATDFSGNTAEHEYVVTVDNTAPTLEVEAPVESICYSGVLPLASYAVDEAGIGQHAVAGLEGATFTGGAELLGSWAPPASPADGIFPATFSACDLVGHCVRQEISVRVDRTPPVLSFWQPPTAATNSNTVTFLVSAVDVSAGVDRVFGRLATKPTERVAGVYESSSRAFQVTMPVEGEGKVSYVLWAEDVAAPRNSGATRGVNPYVLTPTVVRDTKPPVVQLLSGREGGVYRSERDIAHAESATGVPVMPVQYTGLNSVEEAIGEGGILYKSVTRLSPGPLTAADLEALKGNTPWLGFSVLETATEAPINLVTYSISCTGCGSPATSTGNLLDWKLRSSQGDRTYALPITTDTIPGLRNAVTSPVTLKVTVTARDAAGNIGSAPPVNLTLHLVTPTLSIAEQTAYPSARDLKSPYGYRVSGHFPYADLWAPETLAFEGTSVMRIARFHVRNPHSVPMVVNITQSQPGAWKVVEAWSTEARPDATGTRVADGFSFAASYEWDLSGAYGLCATSGGTRPPYPCSVSDGIPETYPLHPMGSTQQWTCDAGSPSTVSIVGQYGHWDSIGYGSPQPLGGEYESSRAPSGYTLSGRAAWRVPAATGTTPGEIVLYVVVPRGRSAPLPTLTAVGDHYEYVYGIGYSTRKTSTCRFDGVTQYMATNDRRLFVRTLNSALLDVALTYNVNAVTTHVAGGDVFPAVGAPRVIKTGVVSKAVDLSAN
ncbi:hypothetical protein FJV41_23910 [Myxococcus llanfairpwllgwyngyllgogerychwyrndrobwllllantysiliogogogochensis]|uniref:Carboxypeptidase regulatory-like domain-containing protein n=1 Tax=Myxococcus llanfairpwllgwyngyllgogerychwyrndrobwllllantysiliogogogochensis TaxID=2590453 RepID=A0A540WWS0_9BACT|nr:hypothetical protein [Myxococcus llanfairpwllgwyngyllgogerychwyrndrobwllllantysiliogogogochensis]TQF13438.1 hypothetical protein FJV41_23910 [Myxococcus llanfairpwllgwyngyllgogerychwyrndrobwllllantysiliogogogochensis]